MRVLVCDDDTEVGEFLRTLFEIEGWESELVGSGEDCLALLASGAELPDVLVLDQRMPGLLGTEVADRLRAPGFVRPIVLCSAHVGPEHRADIAGLDLVQVNKVDGQAVVRIARAAVRSHAALHRR
jgi:CheY-like chemotaxis protein